MHAKLNKRERRAAALLAHYETCERLGRALGMSEPDGKKISVALLKIERDAHNAATAQCNGEAYKGQPFRLDEENEPPRDDWKTFCAEIECRVQNVFGGVEVPGFFFNKDPRGYALKIYNETPAGKALIDAVGMQKDWGGYGILSPEITG